MLFIAALMQAAAAAATVSDAEMRRTVIDASIALYEGNCPCPYHHAADGSKCGGRSAHGRRGGADPFCFDTDFDRVDLTSLYAIAVAVTIDADIDRDGAAAQRLLHRPRDD